MSTFVMIEVIAAGLDQVKRKTIHDIISKHRKQIEAEILSLISSERSET
jgi:hypothetical protein